MNKNLLLAVVALSVATGARSDLTHHWALDEAALVYDGTNWTGVMDPVTGTSGMLWGFAAGDDLTQTGLGVLGNPGPVVEMDFAYDLERDAGTSGVATDLSGVLPATGDFTFLTWINTSNEHVAQGHVFSNNNNQAGRANLFVQNKKVGFWADGFAANGRPVVSTTDIDDGVWHEVGLARHNGTFYLSVDGVIEDSAFLPSVSIDQEVMWMIGRQRSYAGNYEGQVADVKVYNEALPGYVPEVAAVINPIPVHGRLYIDPAEVTLYWSLPQDSTVAIDRYKVFFDSNLSQVLDATGGATYRGDVPADGPLAFQVGKLDFNQTYYWRVDTVLSTGIVLKGSVWNFTTEYLDIPGTVIDYSPNPASIYFGSPAIAMLPDGSYVASHDFFGPGTTSNQTAVFESQDKGTTWKPISLISGQFWSSLFWQDGALYLMGVDGKYGRCVIRRSTDGGVTWTIPADSTSGLLFADSNYHCAPVPVMIHNGRIWRAMEDAKDPGGWGYHFRAFMMSAPVDSDLLNAVNWTSTNRLSHDESNWMGTGWLEGNVVLDPQGRVVNILRVDAPETAAIVSVSADGKTAAFNPEQDFIDFYGGATKFTIRYDAASGRYWSLVNKQADPAAQRNRLVLVSSADLRDWRVEDVILEHPDTAYHAWQYVDWLFEGDAIIFVSRTAYDDGLGGQAHNYHDANFLTFHRIVKFRGPRMPIFDLQPVCQAVGLGQTAVFAAEAHADISSYRWFRQNPEGDTELLDGGDGGDILIASDPNRTTLIIRNTAPADWGNYYCMVTNATGSTFSQVAGLSLYERKMLAHWRLDETQVFDLGDCSGPVHEDTGTQPDGVIWSYTAGMLDHDGPAGGADRAYDFAVDTGISGVATNTGDVIPAAEDFSLLVWFRTDNYHSAQGHLFSNNNGQPGRANLMVQNGNLAWWVSNGLSIKAAPRVDDGLWHQALVTRRGDHWSLYLDGHLMGTQSAPCSLDQTTTWMIGRGRSYNFDYEGLIGDVRIYKYAVDDLPDFNKDGMVNLEDFSVLARWWLASGCGACGGADLTLDEKVDLDDLPGLTDLWLLP